MTARTLILPTKRLPCGPLSEMPVYRPCDQYTRPVCAEGLGVTCVGYLYTSRIFSRSSLRFHQPTWRCYFLLSVFWYICKASRVASTALPVATLRTMPSLIPPKSGSRESFISIR